MKKRLTSVILALLFMIVLFSFALQRFDKPPKTWDVTAIRSMELPNPDPSVKIEPMPEADYNKMPERVPYKIYPFYLPGKEPKGYYDWLRSQEPRVIFNVANMETEADWIKAGEIIYDMPMAFQELDDALISQLPELGENIQKIHVPVTKEGVIPFLSIMVPEKGKLLLGGFSCGMCHTKLMPDGSLLKGGQGNFRTETYISMQAISLNKAGVPPPDTLPPNLAQTQVLFTTPWVHHPSHENTKNLSLPEFMQAFTSITPGMNHRHGTVLGQPLSIPDLFNLQQRKYLDHTGLVQQRSIGDVMRYAALNQNADFYGSYNGFIPKSLDYELMKGRATRFTDAQLYALVKFLYALKPAKNPEQYATSLLTRGEMIFKEQGCVTCHTPPLYTSNKLTPVDGFEPPADHFKKYDIFNVSVNTDPTVALYTRRSTGYYKIPSLIGAWNRTAFLHNGPLATLEDLFDAKRLEPDYMPTGYKPPWLKTMPVKGHEFGLELDEADKKALIAFVKSL